MAVPGISSVLPPSGHTGGKTLVQVMGSDFQVPPAPPAGVPVPARQPDVRVLFGGVPATNVQVWSEAQLFCNTPELDPIELRVAVSIDIANNRFVATGHGLSDGKLVSLEVETGDPTVQPALPDPFQELQGYFVELIDANSFRLARTVAGVPVRIENIGTGDVVVVASGAVDVTVQNIDQSGNVIGSETFTLAAAFTPLRPDLSQESHLATTFGAFIQKVRRQILKNVSWTTNTDYDEDTGDKMNVAYLARVPGIVIGGVDFPVNVERQIGDDEDHAVTDPSDPGDFVTTRAPLVVDIVGTLVALDNDDVRFLSLVQAVKVFFRKNASLTVLRDLNDPSAGTIEYEITSPPDGRSPAAVVGDNDNLKSYSHDFRILGVRLETIPGLPNRSVPIVPSTLIGETVLGVGKTADIIDLTALPK